MQLSLQVVFGCLIGGALFIGNVPAWGQISPYVYVQMSMAVPWFLYFVFLASILLPFFILIIVAWRRYTSSNKVRTKLKR